MAYVMLFLLSERGKGEGKITFALETSFILILLHFDGKETHRNVGEMGLLNYEKNNLLK